jgi:triacylglycerol esterase/lipase EstA (alpha/beta hydrolase family)
MTRNVRASMTAVGGLILAVLALSVSATAAGRERALTAGEAAAAWHNVSQAAIARKLHPVLLKTGVRRARSLTAAERPVIYSFPVAGAIGILTPDASPPGANDWSCRPSASHPRPVVLVHGTFENMILNWNAFSPLLANAGYCVFALNYGSKGLPIMALGPIPDSAVQLRTFIDRVLAATDAPQVDIVGHSQGGMMPRQYLKFEGGQTKVHSLVGLSPSNHGTSSVGIKTLLDAIPGGASLLNGVLDGACEACNDQFTGSPMLTALNAGGDTLDGISYTVIATRRDEVITPYTSSFLAGPDVRNITVQDGCALDQVDHLAITYDRRALAYARNALDPAHPVPVPCTLVLPGVGG